MVPVRDPVALAAALCRMVDDPSLRSRIAEAGRASFEERLEIGRSAERLAAIYRDALASWRLAKPSLANESLGQADGGRVR
jgi:glycosyltransferase involved in cell wall biosynthesis